MIPRYTVVLWVSRGSAVGSDQLDSELMLARAHAGLARAGRTAPIASIACSRSYHSMGMLPWLGDLLNNRPNSLAAVPLRAFACWHDAGCARSYSSSLDGIGRAGMPRLDYDSRGAAKGLQKGGKGRKSLGRVIAIKNTWNNTLISISNSSYKQLGFVSGGTQW